MTFCNCGYNATSRITQTIECPICHSSILVLCTADQGRYAWRLLHTEPNPTPEWFEKVWKREIPNGTCLCDLKDIPPPDFDSLEAFREWAIVAHNVVNRKLGKPQWVGSIYDALVTSSAISPAATK